MSATIIYAVVRATRPVTIDGQDFARGETYASVRFACERHFQHFRRNLRWSAFEVIAVEEKDVKASAIATAAKVAEADLARVEQVAAELADVRGELSQARKDLDAARKRGKNIAALLAELPPEGLAFLEPTQARQVIAAAAALVAKRKGPQPADPAANPAAAARAAAVKDVEQLDGIGPAIAARLVDHHGIVSQEALAERLADAAATALLLADDQVPISEQAVAHWRRQLGIEAPAAGA